MESIKKLTLLQKTYINKVIAFIKNKEAIRRCRRGLTLLQENGSNCTYFFLALSTFDRDLSARTTQEEYVLTMQRMIEYCNARSQGFPVVMPLIGAGQSRTGNDERAILEYLIGLLKMNKTLIMSDIHIVVRNSGKETIPITEL